MKQKVSFRLKYNPDILLKGWKYKLGDTYFIRDDSGARWLAKEVVEIVEEYQYKYRKEVKK